MFKRLGAAFAAACAMLLLAASAANAAPPEIEKEGGGSDFTIDGLCGEGADLVFSSTFQRTVKSFYDDGELTRRIFNFQGTSYFTRSDTGNSLTRHSTSTTIETYADGEVFVESYNSGGSVIIGDGGGGLIIFDVGRTGVDANFETIFQAGKVQPGFVEFIETICDAMA